MNWVSGEVTLPSNSEDYEVIFEAVTGPNSQEIIGKLSCHRLI